MTLESALITGHTGLKGAWLAMFLSQQGVKLTGFSDKIHPLSLYKLASISDVFEAEHWGDVSENTDASRAILNSQAKTIFHFAAQPLVIEAAQNPLVTFDINLGGTWNVLSAFAKSESAEHLVVATTDKVYGSVSPDQGFTETDALRGTEPYSKSKVLADLLSSQYPLPSGKSVTVVRAGNVVGGGDHNLSRLVPEIVYNAKSVIRLRRPEARRPWQHALDVAKAYQSIAETAKTTSRVYNIGPVETIGLQAREVVALGLRALNEVSDVQVDVASDYSFETGDLRLNVSKIKEEIGWSPQMSQEESLLTAFGWHHAVNRGEPPRDVTLQQVDSFLGSL